MPRKNSIGSSAERIGVRRGKSAGQKTGGRKRIEKTVPLDTSDKSLASLLERLKTTVDPDEIRQLSEQIERIVFHKQFANA